jgi:hypothetical protein
MNKLIAIGALIVGTGLGIWWAQPSGSPESAVSAVAASTPSLIEREPSLSAERAAIDPSMLRALIREEVIAALASKPASGPAAAAPVRTPVSTETLAERREAQEKMDTLMAQGIWGNEQRANFQQTVSTLDPEQRERVLQQLTTGINNGTIQVTTDGPPF